MRFKLPIVILLVLCCFACSPERNNVFSKTYHNIAARFNAYFFAREKLDEIERNIWQAHDDNYNRILSIYPQPDTSLINSMEDDFDHVIKMASLAIQRHKNSRWVDDSYVLIGKVRFYRSDFPNAVETFKFVNTKSDDDNARHQALIGLMRTFIENNESANAVAVSDYLKKETLNSDNKKQLHLVRAWYYQKFEDLPNMALHLAEAAPNLSKKEHGARMQ